MVLLFGLVALIAVATLVYRLAVFTLPMLVGIAAGVLAHRTGAGVPGAVAIGFLAAAVALGLGQWLAAPERPQSLRLLVTFVFAAPAALTGFWLVHGLIASSTPSLFWRLALSILGAVVIGASALSKIIGPSWRQALWRAPTMTPPSSPGAPSHGV
jgi:hypothetical protein